MEEHRKGFNIRSRATEKGTSYVVDYLDGVGDRQRKQFKTVTEARRYAEKEHNRLQQFGKESDQLGQVDRADAIKAMRILDGRCTLEQAAKAWVLTNPLQSTLTVKDLVQEFTSWMEATPRKLKGSGSYRPASIHNAKIHLAYFEEKFGSRLVSDVKRGDLKKWLDGLPKKDGFKDSIKRHIAAMYTYGIREFEELADISKPTNDLTFESYEPDPQVWVPNEVELFLNTVPDDTKAAWAILFFAGLRPEEFQRLQPRDIGSKSITVRREVSKTGKKRFVTITETLRAWLKKYPLQKVPTDGRMKGVRLKACENMKLIWIRDLPRNCFATYLSAIKDMEHAANQLGHANTEMLQKHYKAIIEDVEEIAEEFWDIRP